MSTDPRQLGNHVPKVMQLAREAKPGPVNKVVVAHDDWCQIFDGEACNCSPTVSLVPARDVRTN